jgi:hypothetical protein
VQEECGVSNDYENTYFGEPSWLPGFLSPWYQRRARQHAIFLDEIHRWDELADYKGRVRQGIVHTPEYVARMEREQALYDESA